MSLIEEALQRAQTAVAPAPVQPPPASRAPAAPPLPTASGDQRSNRSRAAFGIGLAALGVGLTAFLFRQSSSPSLSRMPEEPALVQESPVTLPRSADVPVTPSLSSRKARVPSQPARSPSSSAPPLALTGIVNGPGEPMALINGKIARLGDVVDGAVLLEVGTGFARVRWQNQELILRTTP